MVQGHIDLIVIVGIAVGLSMDALAVSVVNGFVIEELHLRHALRIAFFFGLFQALMPLAGWTAGLTIRSYIKSFDHWVAFGLLTFVGAKMLWESRSLKDAADCRNCLHFPTLLILSIATSIDALAVGLSFAMLQLQILLPVLVIGAITFVICLAGTQIGKRFGHLIENKLEIAGGIVLILIGLKILIEHLVLGI
jgi:putative Mn2+ efflux pump MntP